jgi:hypothetical protein
VFFGRTSDSKFTNVRVSFYVLKTNQTRKDDPLDFYDSMGEELIDKMEDLGIMGASSFRADLLWELVAVVKDIQSFELSRQKLSAALSTKVAIYFDECEELAREQDSLNRK